VHIALDLTEGKRNRSQYRGIVDTSQGVKRGEKTRTLGPLVSLELRAVPKILGKLYHSGVCKVGQQRTTGGGIINRKRHRGQESSNLMIVHSGEKGLRKVKGRISYASSKTQDGGREGGIRKK